MPSSCCNYSLTWDNLANAVNTTRKLNPAMHFCLTWKKGDATSIVISTQSLGQVDSQRTRHLDQVHAANWRESFLLATYPGV